MKIADGNLIVRSFAYELGPIKIKTIYSLGVTSVAIAAQTDSFSSLYFIAFSTSNGDVHVQDFELNKAYETVENFSGYVSFGPLIALMLTTCA